jgi:hypothetical protein
MKITKVLFSILFLATFLIIVAGGCHENHPESTQTLKMTTQPMNGSNTRLLSITSTEYFLDKKQNDVRTKLEATINGGKYNIIAVKTLYSSGYLTAAEVTYNVSGRGDGNNIRVMFIQSDEHYWDRKAADIKHRLNAVVNSGKYDIIKINTTYAEGYLIAAEIYYREKQ